METTYLAHHGVKGMHWGVRRYQNADGSLTSAGKKRYDGGSDSSSKKGMSEKTKKNLKTAAKVGAVVAGSALAAYGAYKFHDYIRSENRKVAHAASEAAKVLEYNRSMDASKKRYEETSVKLLKNASAKSKASKELASKAENAKRAVNITNEKRVAAVNSYYGNKNDLTRRKMEDATSYYRNASSASHKINSKSQIAARNYDDAFNAYTSHLYSKDAILSKAKEQAKRSADTAKINTYYNMTDVNFRTATKQVAKDKISKAKNNIKVRRTRR